MSAKLIYVIKFDRAVFILLIYFQNLQIAKKYKYKTISIKNFL